MNIVMIIMLQRWHLSCLLNIFLEYLCYTFSAGMTYQGKNWTKEYQLSYWNKIKDQARMDSKLKALLDKVYTEVSEKGLDAVLKKKYLKRLYESYINEK